MPARITFWVTLQICPGTLTSPGPQPSARCLSVGVGRSLALGSPDSGFPGTVGLRQQVPASQSMYHLLTSLPVSLLCLPEPARSSSRAPCQAADSTASGMGRAPVSDPWEPAWAGAPTHSQGLQRTGAPKAPPVRHGVPILSAVGRALLLLLNICWLYFFFPFFNVQAVKKYVC